MDSSSQASLTPTRVGARPSRADVERTAHAQRARVQDASMPLFRAFLRSRSTSAVARTRRVCPQYLALTTLVVIFVSALYFAISNWRAIDREDALDDDWTPERCTLTGDIQLQPRPNSRHGVFVEVRLGNDSTTRPAYYGLKESAYDRSDAEAIKRDLTRQRESNDDQLQCWVRGRLTAPSAISLRRVTTSSSVYLAWAGTFMAAVIGVILITVCSSSASSTMGVSALTPMTLASPPVAKSVHLTERQATRICTRFSDRLPRGAARDWTCSICLEEDGDEDNTNASEMLDTTMLPCGHRFHAPCIKQWLWKGKGLCPLCKWDARKFIAAEKQAGVEGEWHDAATTAASSSAVGDGAPLSQSSLALTQPATRPPTRPPSPPQPPQPPQPVAAQNVSHVSIDVDQLARSESRH